jgi:hypothetical protein
MGLSYDHFGQMGTNQMLDNRSKRYYNKENGETVMKFAIGSSVEITTKWRSNILGKEFDFNTFKGKVVPNPKWLDSDYVSVHTGNPSYPTSFIHKKFIVGHAFSEQRSTQRLFRVASKSSGKTYHVTSDAGSVTCDCVGFQFRAKCKHSEKVKDLLERQNNA